MKKIGFIITTFLRNELLFKSVKSLLKYKQDNWEIIIVDQNGNFKKHDDFNNNMKLHYYSVDYNSGLSFGRNFGVKVAKNLGCSYCFISSDSFLFNESIKNIDKIVNILEDKKFDKIGFELENSTSGCGWEAFLNLIEGQSFELDFIDKTAPLGIYDYWKIVENGNIIEIRACDITRNIFLATTNSLLNIPWDENLKLGEHECQNWRYKLVGYKTGWTNYIYAIKMTDRPDEYAKFRKQNFNEGIKKLREKYNISGWVTYKNLQRAKDYYKKEV
jgi:glycosyltransferase involved in cell wall biosynthesis